MSISTKTGDKGTTSLWSGQRVRKDSLRVEAYGTIDELDSHLSEALFYIETPLTRQYLDLIQQKLYRVMGQLATKDKEFVAPILPGDVEEITALVHHLEADVRLTGFVKTGRIVSSAKLDICRTIIRRGERRILELHQTEEVDENLRMLINRLSDLIFIMARYEEKLVGKLEYKTL
jgi:ATP:cob(I)alamin adenosyltransferase